MKRLRLILGILALMSIALFIFFVLKSEKALLIHPKGTIARSELKLITTNIYLMLLIILPTIAFLFFVVWRSRKAKHDPEHSIGKWGEGLLWVIPAIIVAFMTVITWKATHKLDPYRPLESKTKPLVIQVVALDWKWLFIYPEQGIASLNFVQFPVNTPVHFELSADGSPMNSFWIPQLSGQIYAMTGMITQLHLMADDTGEYVGRAAEINGKGYSDMTFVAKSTSLEDFEAWVSFVKQSPLSLDDVTYKALILPSINTQVVFYSNVEKNLFHQIVMKYASPKGS